MGFGDKTRLESMTVYCGSEGGFEAKKLRRGQNYTSIEERTHIYDRHPCSEGKIIK